MNKVLILTEGDKISGTATWRKGLVEQLKKERIEVKQVDVSKLRSVFEINKIFSTEVIHNYHISGLSTLYAFLGKLLGKKIVFTLHGNYLEEGKSKFGIKKILWTPLHKMNILISDTVTVASRFLKVKVGKYNNRFLQKTRVIPNGVFPRNIKSKKRSLKRKDGYTYILEVTNFNYIQKADGVIPLIKAVKSLIQKGFKIKLNVLGGGKFLGNYKPRLETSDITFLGRIETEKYYQSCDVFVHSTFLDNFPYVILEAMTFDKPVVGVKVGGIPELLPKEAVVDPEVSSIEKILRKVISNKDFEKKLIKIDKEIIPRFYWSNVVKKYLRIYG